jgi:two-component system phosphate regulon sensor histidine kinase PhoR
MSSSQMKPWTHSEDDADAFRESSASSRAESSAHGAGGSSTSKLPASLRRLFPKAFSPWWTLWPLSVALLWTLLGFSGLGRANAGLGRWESAALLIITASAVAIVASSQRHRRDALADVRRAIALSGREVGRMSSPPPMEDELRSLWESVQAQGSAIERQMLEVMDDHKQLSLQRTLAETQRRQMEAVFDSIAEPLLVSDSFGHLVLANAAAGQLFGFDPANSQRKRLDEIITDAALLDVVRRSREADVRAARRRAEHQINTRIFESTLSSFGSAGVGESAQHGVVMMLRDITHERESSKAKSNFVAQVSHELRTPLSAISGYVEMLVDGETTDEKTRREYYEIIHSSADRLGRLIDNMLNISRIEAGTVRINKEPVSLAMIVKEAVDTLRPQAEAKEIKLTDELTPVVYRVVADRDLLHQAILNLVSNAIKYTPESGSVHVRMTPHEEHQQINIEVIDTGAGIPLEVQPRIFEKFFRVEENKKLAKGTGLGLNLVKQIVETVHGGQVTLTSAAGRGSTFEIVLPLTT